MNGEVISVNCSPTHSLIKPNQEQVRLLAGLGVEGDAHAGTTVKHRSRVARNPDQPDLRQVHLIHSELYAELREAGFDVSHGQMGENITTGGVDLFGLPTGALLRIRDAVVEITGLRNPCAQLNKIQPGLLDSVLGYDEDGKPGPWVSSSPEVKSLPVTRYWSSYPRDRTSRFFQFSWFGPLEEVPPGVGVNFGLEPFYDPVPDRAAQVESRLDQVAFVGNHTFREGGLRCPCTGADADSHAQIGQGGPDSLEEFQLGLHRLGRLTGLAEVLGYDVVQACGVASLADVIERLKPRIQRPVVQALPGDAFHNQEP